MIGARAGRRTSKVTMSASASAGVRGAGKADGKTTQGEGEEETLFDAASWVEHVMCARPVKFASLLTIVSSFCFALTR